MSSIVRPLKARSRGNSRSRRGASRRRPALAAFARFAAAGLPTRRIEAWHYTDLRASMADAAPILPARPRPPRVERRAAGSRTRALRGRAAACPVGRTLYRGAFGSPAGGGLDRGGTRRRQTGRRSAGGSQRSAEPVRSAQFRSRREAELAEPITLLHLANEASTHSVYSRIGVRARRGRAGLIRRDIRRRSCGRPATRSDDLTLAEGARATHVAVVGDEPGLHIETQICELARGLPSLALSDWSPAAS